MSVTLTGAGGLFTRLGSIFKIVEQVETHVSDIDTRVSTADGQFTAADRSMVLPLVGAREAVKQTAGAVMVACWQAAQATVVEMVQDDAPRVAADLDLALRELIRQMDASASSVNTNVAGASAAAVAGNTGTGTVAAHVQYQANVRAEKVNLRCVRDGQYSGRASDVSFMLQSAAQDAPRTDPTWPRGSSQSKTIPQIDTAQDRQQGAARQMLTNGDFEDFSVANIPDGWTVVVGTPATTLLRDPTNFHRGAQALEIRGNGAQLTKIEQQCSGLAGVCTRLKPKTPYIVGFWYRDSSAGHPGSGVLRVSLRDSGYAEIASSSITLAASTATGSWQFTSRLFTMPDTIPAGARLVVELTTAMPGATGLLLDDLFMCEAFPIQGVGTVYGVVVPGSTEFVVDDRFVITTTNDKAGKFLRHFDRAFEMYERGLNLPQSAAPTVSDALIA